MVVNKCFKYIIRALIWGIFILYVGFSVFLNLPFVQKKMASLVSSTLEEVLKEVAGACPLLIELKTDRFGNTRLAAKIQEAIKGYPGVWWVQSFDPLQNG